MADKGYHAGLVLAVHEAGVWTYVAEAGQGAAKMGEQGRAARGGLREWAEIAFGTRGESTADAPTITPVAEIHKSRQGC